MNAGEASTGGALRRPLVAVVMGSESDMPVMQGACEVLGELGVEYELKIASAHRTPDVVREYATRAEERGLEVIIAGAGGAAHLPGIIAAYTLLPVIGVPVKTSALGGVDSLYSIVQMPTGVPVATVAIDGAKNAALLACEILALKYSELREKLIAYREAMRRKVLGR